MSRSRVVVDTRALDRLVQRMPGRIDALGRSIATGIMGDIVESFGVSPSSPGEPPGVDTGALRASMHWLKIEDGLFRVADGVEYGIYLEMGTSMMEARPFFLPVFMAWQANGGRKIVALARGLFT